MDGKNHKVLTADRDTYPFALTIDKVRSVPNIMLGLYCHSAISLISFWGKYKNSVF